MILHCVSKKLYHFCICNNFFNREPIFTIFGKNVAKGIGNICRALCPCYWQFEYLTVENQLKCCSCSRKHVALNVEDRILVENLYKFKGYRAKTNSKFPDKGWTVNGLKYLLKKLRDSGTKARQPGSGRRQSARTVENVDTVNDLVLSHKGH